MNPQLTALFTQHRTAVLGVGAAGVLGLALLKRKNAGAGAGAATPGTGVAGTIPAAAVIPTGSTGSGGYNSSSSDLYQALQPTLEQILQQQQQQTSGGGITTAPKPVASGLFAPTASGNYALYGNGTVAEVESDGSQLGLTSGQWNSLLSSGARVTTTMPQKDPVGAYYETAQNLAGKTKPTS